MHLRHSHWRMNLLNKTLKLQLKTLFHCMDEEREAAINDLINSYDNFNDVYENWEWFKQQAFNLINKKSIIKMYYLKLGSTFLLYTIISKGDLKIWTKTKKLK